MKNLRAMAYGVHRANFRFLKNRKYYPVIAKNDKVFIIDTGEFFLLCAFEYCDWAADWKFKGTKTVGEPPAEIITTSGLSELVRSAKTKAEILEGIK